MAEENQPAGMPYHANADVGSTDWLNEAHCSYFAGNYERASVAAILFHAESVDALRLLLIEGALANTDQPQNVRPLSDSIVKGS
jgi:hypothetical protein